MPLDVFLAEILSMFNAMPMTNLTKKTLQRQSIFQSNICLSNQISSSNWWKATAEATFLPKRIVISPIHSSFFSGGRHWICRDSCSSPIYGHLQCRRSKRAHPERKGQRNEGSWNECLWFAHDGGIFCGEIMGGPREKDGFEINLSQEQGCNLMI